MFAADDVLFVFILSLGALFVFTYYSIFIWEYAIKYDRNKTEQRRKHNLIAEGKAEYRLNSQTGQIEFKEK